MAGHSKWANIRHTKARIDAKRGKVFTKLIRLLTVAAKDGGSDPDSNATLRAAIDKAQAANMPKDTMERAIKRGAGELDGQVLESIRYEGYGPAGVAVMVSCLTDNRNRTVAEVRHAFVKANGNLGTDGSVSYLFSKQGQIIFSAGADEDAIMEIALEANADDVEVDDDGSIVVITQETNFMSIKDALTAKNLIPENADVTMVASMEVTLDQDNAEKVIRLVDALEDLDDVQNVYTNADISSEIMSNL